MASEDIAGRRLANLAKNPSTALSHEHEVGVDLLAALIVGFGAGRKAADPWFGWVR